MVHGQDLPALIGAFGTSPITGFPILAQAFAESIEGNDTFLTIPHEIIRAVPKWEDGYPNSPSPVLMTPPVDYVVGILCSEAEPVNDKSVRW